jgi:hypothetical protein
MQHLRNNIIVQGILIGLVGLLIISLLIHSSPKDTNQSPQVTLGSAYNIETYYGWPQKILTFYQYGPDSCLTASGCPPTQYINWLNFIEDIIAWCVLGIGLAYVTRYVRMMRSNNHTVKS